MPRALGILVLLSLLLLGSACSGDPGTPGPGSAGASRPLAGEPEETTASAGLEEVPPGFDESPDGAPPVPDDQLDDDELTRLLRTRASTPTSPRRCRAEEVAVTLEGFDAAAGTRFSRLVVRNTSRRACTVEGVPGIGVRGAWGSTFVPEVLTSDRGADGRRVPAEPVRLDPGESASADLQWSGDLAGAETERASLVVLQLASGQVPATTPARLVTDPPGAPTVDIGQFTTIQLTPFVAS